MASTVPVISDEVLNDCTVRLLNKGEAPDLWLTSLIHRGLARMAVL